jgi:FkbM family methyltransferase
MTLRGRLIRSQIFRDAKEPLRAGLRRLGYEVSRSGSSYTDLIARLLSSENVGTVVDVGANQGQYGHLMRHIGWNGPIISFEPGAEAFRRLARTAEKDGQWQAINAALGATRGAAVLNVAQNSVSSSLLTVSPLHIASEKEASTQLTEAVQLSTLDSYFEDWASRGKLWLKLDVQGFELQVLGGAAFALDSASVIQVELSLRSLYDGGADYIALLAKLDGLGFAPIWFEPAFQDPTSGELMQVDVLAARRP